MRVELAKGDVLEVVFEEAEQIFEIAHTEDNLIAISQTFGYELDPHSEVECDYKEIYREKVV